MEARSEKKCVVRRHGHVAEYLQDGAGSRQGAVGLWRKTVRLYSLRLSLMFPLLSLLTSARALVLPVTGARLCPAFRLVVPGILCTPRSANVRPAQSPASPPADKEVIRDSRRPRMEYGNGLSSYSSYSRGCTTTRHICRDVSL